MRVCFFTLFLFFSCSVLSQTNVSLFLGTYTNGESKGIYEYTFDTKNGTIDEKKLAANTESPSFLYYSRKNDIIYAVGEVANFEGTKNGFVSAFRKLVGSANGQTMRFMNKVSTNGAHPCHIQLNKSETMAVISNYSGGNISIHPIAKSGEILEAIQVIDHNSPLEKSHAHAAKFYKNNLFVADLGRNSLFHYTRSNTLEEPFSLKATYFLGKDSGPRHFEISKDGNFIYVINELNSTVSALKKQGELYTEVQNISTLDEAFDGESFCADVHLSKNEKYLYGSNRGENSIVVFERSMTTGTLKKIQTIGTEGNWPRNFTLTPGDKYLMVANQKSNNISVFEVDMDTGTLTFLYSFAAPSPVCLQF